MHKSLVGFIFLIFSASSFAQCDLPTALENLDINNVDALIRNGQSMWYNDGAYYKVPKNEEASVLFCGNFWIAGYSQSSGQLHLAGGRYYFPNKSDFFPGPLSLVDAQVSVETCGMYDKIWVIYREEVERHLEYFDCFQNPNCDLDVLFPLGYSTPSQFLDYPAQGDVSLGQASNLAPWYDYNNDGIYNPEQGDCPLFDFMTNLTDCQSCSALKGDMCLYWIDNDMGNEHSATTGVPLGVEIHNMAYSFASSGVLDNTTFYNKRIINRSSNTYTQTYLGLWMDPDIGGYVDDYNGCDVGRNLAFAYNGLEFDQGMPTAPGYGENPPAAGIKLLQGPLFDSDMIDNDNDGVVDNERADMISYVGTSASNAAYSIYIDPVDYYNRMRAVWSTGEHVICGGNGYNLYEDTVFTETNWNYPGNSSPDTCGFWSESSVGSPPGGRVSSMGSGPFTFAPGDEQCIEYAVVWARPDEFVDVYSASNVLALSSDTIGDYFEECFSSIPPGVAINTIELQPLSFRFSNYSSADVVLWEFGDGSTSTEERPVHTYSEYGTYTVSLEVVNENGSATGSVDLVVQPVSVETLQPLVCQLFPNPVEHQLFIDFKSVTVYQVNIYDLLGNQLLSKEMHGDDFIDVSNLSAGAYCVSVISVGMTVPWTSSFVKL